MTAVNDPIVFANAFSGCMSGIINSSRENTTTPQNTFDNQNEVANLFALEFDTMWALLGPSRPTQFDYSAIESNSASTWYNRNLPDTSSLGAVTSDTFGPLCILIIESILSADNLIEAEGITIPYPPSGGGTKPVLQVNVRNSPAALNTNYSGASVWNSIADLEVELPTDANDGDSYFVITNPNAGSSDAILVTALGFGDYIEDPNNMGNYHKTITMNTASQTASWIYCKSPYLGGSWKLLWTTP